MKGQQAIIYVILTIITLVLLFSTLNYSSESMSRTTDLSRISSSEAFMKNLDARIQDAASSGVDQEINFDVADAKLELQGSDIYDILDLTLPVSSKTSDDWKGLNTNNMYKHGSAGDSISVIRERQADTNMELQLFYRMKNNYAIDLYAENMSSSQNGKIIITRANVLEQNIEGLAYTVAKVNLEFE